MWYTRVDQITQFKLQLRTDRRVHVYAYRFLPRVDAFSPVFCVFVLLLVPLLLMLSLLSNFIQIRTGTLFPHWICASFAHSLLVCTVAFVASHSSSWHISRWQQQIFTLLECSPNHNNLFKLSPVWTRILFYLEHFDSCMPRHRFFLLNG